MKYKLLFITLFMASQAFSGDWEKRSLSYFSEVKISGNLRVELVKSDTSGLEIYDPCCSGADIKVRQEGRKLVVNYDKGLLNDSQYNLIIYYTELSELEVQRGASVECREDLVLQSINISASSGSTLNLGIKSDFIDITASSGSSVHLDGEVEKLEANVNAGASMDLERLKAKRADVKAHTGGSIDLSVVNEIRGLAATGASIHYHGNPEIKDLSTNLGGSVSCSRELIE